MEKNQILYTKFKNSVDVIDHNNIKFNGLRIAEIRKYFPFKFS